MVRRRSIVGLITVFCLSLGVVFGAALPKNGFERGSPRSGASRLVTGEAAHLQSVIDGGVAGGTYYIRMAPVDPLNGDSYGDNCVIAGNTITCNGGPQRIWFDIVIGGWAPDSLRTYQVAMGFSVLASGTGAPLVLPVESCTANADCVTAFGPGAQCLNALNTECTYAWEDASRPNYHGLPIAAVANYDPIRWGATAISQYLADPGTDVYAGSLVVDAQAGSGGTFTLEFLRNDATYFRLQDGSKPDLALFTFTPAVVQFQGTFCCLLPGNSCTSVATQGACDALGGSFVDDGDLCTAGACNDSGGCDSVLLFDPAAECCNGSTGDVTTLDDGDPCTLDTCDGTGVVGDRDPSTAGTAIHGLMPPLPGDLDNNCVVDLVDYSLMLGCFKGPNTGTATLVCPPTMRAAADLDDDNDVDLQDAADFFTLLTSP